MKKIKLAKRELPRCGKFNTGFTLIEIMVVVAIIGLLAMAVVPQVFKQLEGAQENRVRQDINAIEAALGYYKLDNFTYPLQSDGLQALLVAPSNARNWRGPYIKTLEDPWENEYRYANPGVHGEEIEVFTYGQDNAEGGDGADADWGSWNIR